MERVVRTVQGRREGTSILGDVYRDGRENVREDEAKDMSNVMDKFTKCDMDTPAIHVS